MDEIQSEIHEECGVFGVYSQENRDVAVTTCYGLYALQHRGQESAGIAVAYADRIVCRKGMGLHHGRKQSGKRPARRVHGQVRSHGSRAQRQPD